MVTVVLMPLSTILHPTMNMSHDKDAMTMMTMMTMQCNDACDQ